MSQNLNNNNIDKNLKLMGISAIALVILFFYTIFKSSSYIQSGTYTFGIVFISILLLFAFFARFYKDKLQKFFNKNRVKNSAFENELAKNESSKSINEINETSHIEVVKSNTTFNDVAGIASVKEELEEVVDFLNNPKKYKQYGVKLPKGVLLVGPPGVGKTLIARAVAGEANVPFFYQSGASFVQIYVGMGAKRVRELFEKAKANAPAIVFIDEIDAVGKARSGKSNDEREATLNELLTQMDGFEGDSGIIVIAATNKLDVLDDALLRAGRFDRRVHLNLPNIDDRKKILDLYLKNINYEFDLEKLAFNTAGFSSASLATLINEALLNMIKVNNKILSENDIETAKNKLEFGKKEKHILDEKQREILAIYQASKAFISKKKVSFFDETSTNIKDVFPSKSQLKQMLKNYLSGSIGIEVLKDEPYAIFAEDLKKANDLAATMVNDYAMAKDSNELIDMIKGELRNELYQNINEIDRLTEIMLKNEVITLDDI